jgi:hypothetical protein
LWATADGQRRDWEQYKSLKLRRAILADDNSARVSPDISAIEELIRQHGETKVKVAWAFFSANPAPHCEPPCKGGGEPNEEATKYPVTVFLAHFDSYLSDGMSEVKAYEDSNRTKFPETVWLILEYNKLHPRQ